MYPGALSTKAALPEPVEAYPQQWIPLYILENSAAGYSGLLLEQSYLVLRIGTLFHDLSQAFLYILFLGIRRFKKGRGSLGK